MIRRLVLAVACLPALAGPAAAQCGNCAQETTQLASWAAQARSVGQQIQQATMTLQQLQATYAAFTGVRDLGSAMSALGMVGIQNPLPISPYAVQGLISGSGGMSGIGGNLGSLFTGSYASNSVYTPTGTDWRATEMVRNAASLAGIQALAQRGYQAASDRLTQLAGLQARQSIASDPKEVQDLQLAVARVQADAASQQQQIQSLAMMTQIQERVMQQRDAEHRRMETDQLIAYLRQNEN